MNLTEHRPLDHKRLVFRRRTEIARAIHIYRELEGVNQVTILHEVNDSCCKREPWPQTLIWILTHIKKRVLYVNPYEVGQQEHD